MAAVAAFAFGVLVFALVPTPASAAIDDDIAVDVRLDGAEVRVAVDCPVVAPPALVWDVLTDYDHMTRYVANLQESRILSRDADRLRIYQKGKASRGILTFSFENVREVELIPGHEVRSKLISGDLKASEFTTRIVERDNVVHILNSGHFIPKVWVPPLIGPPIIAGETRKQFGEIRTEILRRKAFGTGEAPAGPPLAATPP